MISKGLKFAQEELPPRARRILEGFTDVVNAGGTTSACAENTLIASLISLRIWNYLRVRGEYGEIRLRDIENLELPPRARRIRYISPARADWMGTTSACAENTSA